MPCVSCLHKYTVNGGFKHFSVGGKKSCFGGDETPKCTKKKKKSMPSKISKYLPCDRGLTVVPAACFLPLQSPWII